MSSRALRKAQKQREEQEALAALKKEAEELESSEEEVELQPRQSAFALLDQGDGESDDHDEIEDNTEQVSEEDDDDSREPKHSAPNPKTKRRKKKKKPSKVQNDSAAIKPEAAVDEIEAALQELATSSSKGDAATTLHIDPEVARACALLAVDQQNLHAENEMRRLFGRAAMDSNDEDAGTGGGRRRNQQQRMVGLAGALGRQQGAPGGRSSGLGLLGLRRNPFISGKEEWPIATSGGLGMEVVSKDENGVVEYRFVHNRAYQEVQSDFDICVGGMDPERMVRLLQLNPYHISTLLQVSEIAKQERDHSTAGDLLERALFTFGRSLHSTFSASLAQGKARLDFRRPENREFWLAISRYITNLSMRATWRTVLEWAKMMLALDPVDDPYQMRLVIDQYAIRARQPQLLVDMNANLILNSLWKELPGMKFSVGLALTQTGQAGKGKQALFTASNQYPWVSARLFQELNLDPPPGIWGKSARTDWEKLQTELYATRAKDVWNTPEASALLVEVSSAVDSGAKTEAPARDISLDEGRHVLLSDKPELIALLPKTITSKLTGISDPLPPDDDLPSYSTSASAMGASSRGFAPPGVRVVRQTPGLVEHLLQLRPALRRFQGPDGLLDLNADGLDEALAEALRDPDINGEVDGDVGTGDVEDDE